MGNQLLKILISSIVLVIMSGPVSAQDKGSVDPKPLPPLANPNDPHLGAKELFARKILPASLAVHSIGFYAKGCLAVLKHSVLHPRLPTTPPKPRPPITLADLPAACRQILIAP